MQVAGSSIFWWIVDNKCWIYLYFNPQTNLIGTVRLFYTWSKMWIFIFWNQDYNTEEEAAGFRDL